MSTEPSLRGPSRRTFLSVAIAAAGASAAAPLVSATNASAAGPSGDFPAAPPPTAQPPDAALVALLQEIDPKRIEATVRALVSFGTRHTLSSQTDPQRGIGAAAQWLFEQYQQVAATSGGHMTVEKQSYVQQPASRIPVPTTITNIVATLQGSADPGRTYVVSGHYDSRSPTS